MYSPKAHDDAVAYPTVVAKSGVPADDDSAEMINDEISANHDLARQVDASEYLAQFV